MITPLPSALIRTGRAAAAAILFCLLLPAMSVATESLRITFEEYPPYEYIEHGKFKGISIELIQEVCRRLDIQPEFTPRPWKRALLEVETGTADAISSGFRTPERELFAIYPDEPLAAEENVIYAHPKIKRVAKSLAGLAGKRVGVVKSYNYDEEFDAASHFIREPSNTTAQLLEKFAEGRSDYIIGNKLVLHAVARQMGIERLLRLTFVVSQDHLYIMFSKKHARAPRLARDFTRELLELRKSGFTQALERKYLEGKAD